MFKAVIIYVILHCEEIWRTAGSNEKMTAVNLGVWSATIHSRINYQWLIQDLYWTEIKNQVGNTTARSILSLPNTFIVTVSTTYRHVFHLYYSAPTLPFHVITLYNTTHQFVVSQITSDLFSNRLFRAAQLSTLPSTVEKCQTFTIFTMMAKIQCDCKIICMGNTTITDSNKAVLISCWQEAMSTSTVNEPSSSSKSIEKETPKSGTLRHLLMIIFL